MGDVHRGCGLARARERCTLLARSRRCGGYAGNQPEAASPTSSACGSGELNRGDRWIADLTAAVLAASRRQDEQATAPQSQPGVQGQEPAPAKAGRALAAVKGGAAQGFDDAEHRWKGCGGEKTLAELAQQYDVHPDLTNQWRARLPEGAADVFGAEPAAAEPAIDVTVLHAKIGELTLANDFGPVRSARPVCCRAQSDGRPWSCAAAGAR